MGQKNKKGKEKGFKYLDTYFEESQFLNRVIPTKEDLMEEYEDLKDEIAYYQYQIFKTDKKARKKQLKKGTPVFLTSEKQIKKRKKILKKMQKGNLLDRIIAYLNEKAPLFRALGKFVAKFICSFLNFDEIKKHINRKWLDRLDMVYTVCVNL